MDVIHLNGWFGRGGAVGEKSIQRNVEVGGDFLGALLSQKLTVEEKLTIMETEYHIPVEEKTSLLDL